MAWTMASGGVPVTARVDVVCVNQG
jgi:hypothetical protein